MYYAYLVKCADGSLYAGWTDDMQKRLGAHNAGRGGKYTRSRLPVTLWHCETFDTRSAAMRRECALKGLSRAEKLALKGAPSENEDQHTGGDKHAKQNKADF